MFLIQCKINYTERLFERKIRFNICILSCKCIKFFFLIFVCLKTMLLLHSTLFYYALCFQTWDLFKTEKYLKSIWLFSSSFSPLSDTTHNHTHTHIQPHAQTHTSFLSCTLLLLLKISPSCRSLQTKRRKDLDLKFFYELPVDQESEYLLKNERTPLATLFHEFLRR